MIASSRQARRQLRDLRRANTAKRRAVRAVATGRPQTMRVHLLALGLDPKRAKNYAGTVSKNVPVSADVVDVRRKLKGRKVATFPAYVYTGRQVVRALTAYLRKGGPKRMADLVAFTAIRQNVTRHAA